MALQKRRAQKEKIVDEDLELSDASLSDGGDGLLSEDSDDDTTTMVVFQEREKKKPRKDVDPRMQFDDSVMKDADKIPSALVRGMCFKDSNSSGLLSSLLHTAGKKLLFC